MIAWRAPPGDADPERLVPLDDRREIRPDQPVDVVARSPLGQLGWRPRRRSPARQVRAPQIPNADGEPIAALDRLGRPG